MLCGKLTFNYIYGIGVLGCIGIYGLLTLMANNQVSFCVVVSVLVNHQILCTWKTRGSFWVSSNSFDRVLEVVRKSSVIPCFVFFLYFLFFRIKFFETYFSCSRLYADMEVSTGSSVIRDRGTWDFLKKVWVRDYKDLKEIQQELPLENIIQSKSSKYVFKTKVAMVLLRTTQTTTYLQTSTYVHDDNEFVTIVGLLFSELLFFRATAFCQSSCCQLSASSFRCKAPSEQSALASSSFGKTSNNDFPVFPHPSYSYLVSHLAVFIFQTNWCCLTLHL